MLTGRMVREVCSQVDRDTRALAHFYEALRPRNDDSVWDCAGDDCIYDADGFHVCEYVKCGTEAPSYWDEMVQRLI